MIIRNGKKELFRTDENGRTLINAINTSQTYITFNMECDGFFDENSILSFEAKKYSTNGEIIDTIDIIAQPSEPLHPYIIQVTGLSSDSFNNALNQKEAVRKIKEFINDVDIIIGYNIFADLEFLSKKVIEVSHAKHFDILEMLRDFFPAKELNSYSPEDIFDLYSIDYITRGYTESINRVFEIMLSQYIEYFNKKSSNSLKKMTLNSLYYEVIPPYPRQLYINTNIGQFTFSLNNLAFALRKSKKVTSITNVDMEFLRQLILHHFKVADDIGLYLFLNRKTDYKAILN